jgi:CBS domain-containing protein
MLNDTSVMTRHAVATGDRLDTPLRDVMRPGAIVIADDASVQDAQRALVAHRVHSVLVLDHAAGRALGWITTRGLLPWYEREVELACARDAVSEPAITIGPSASVRAAFAALEREGASRLLVARHHSGLPEGVVSDSDLLRFVAR